MKHYYPNVPGIGNVAVSRHAQDRLAEDGISEREFEASCSVVTRCPRARTSFGVRRTASAS
jgi:hypothetical protein